MKKMSSIISILVITLFLMTSCTKNQSCKNEKLGDIELSARADNFTVYGEGQKVIFINQEGEEMIFNNKKSTRIGKQIKIGDGREGNDLIYGSYTCYDYYQNHNNVNRLTSSDEKIRLDVMVSNESDDLNINREKVKFNFKHYNEEGVASDVAGYYFYNEQEFEVLTYGNFEMAELEKLEINGKIFTHVLSSKNEIGSVYFKETEGIIGFAFNGGDVWVAK